MGTGFDGRRSVYCPTSALIEDCKLSINADSLRSIGILIATTKTHSTALEASCSVASCDSVNKLIVFIPPTGLLQDKHGEP